MSEQKEEEYDIAIKLSLLPTKQMMENEIIINGKPVLPIDMNGKAQSKTRILFNKYGTRDKWHVSAKTRKVRDASARLYSAISSGCRYGNNTITARYFKNQFKDYAFALRELYAISLYGTDFQGILITHGNTYQVDKVRCIRTIDPYLQNPNNINNAYVINKVEVKKLYDKYYKVWAEEMAIKNNIDTLQVNVNKLINNYRMLDNDINSNVKKLDDISRYDGVTFSIEEMRMYFLGSNDRFIKNLGTNFVVQDRNIWDKVDTAHRKVSRFMGYLEGSVYSMNQTYDMSWADLNTAQEYIKNSWDDEHYAPKMKNHNNYNTEKRRYEFVTIEDLPTMIQFAEKATTFKEIQNRYKSKLNDMKLAWIASLAEYDADFLSPVSRLDACVIN